MSLSFPAAAAAVVLRGGGFVLGDKGDDGDDWAVAGMECLAFIVILVAVVVNNNNRMNRVWYVGCYYAARRLFVGDVGLSPFTKKNCGFVPG